MPLVSKKTAFILRHFSDCHERNGAYSWATYKALVTKAMPEAVKGLSPYNGPRELTTTTDKERYETSRDPRTARRNTMGCSEHHLKI